MALTKTDEFIKNTDINKSPTGVAERLVYQENLSEKDATITELQAENAQLQAKLKAQQERIAELEQQAQQSKQSAVKSEQGLEYNGDLPQGTNEDKLADFIDLVFNPALRDEHGKIPTYSRLHTKLSYEHNNRAIPSKNTIKKYLNQP